MPNCFLYDDCNHKDCEKEFCLRKYKLESLYEAGLISPQQRIQRQLFVDADGTDYEEFVKLAAIEKDIVNFVKTNQNLYLFSPNCGNGKSSWAVRLLRAYINKIWVKSALTCRVLFINVPKFLLALKEDITTPNAYARYILANVENADLVVWDDIAAGSCSEFDVKKLLGSIESRLIRGKSNIYTSNVDFSTLQKTIGQMLASRVYQLSTCIELHGADKRGIYGKVTN